MKFTFFNILFLLGFFVFPLHAEEKSTAADDAKLYIISPLDVKQCQAPSR